MRKGINPTMICINVIIGGNIIARVNKRKSIICIYANETHNTWKQEGFGEAQHVYLFHLDNENVDPFVLAGGIEHGTVSKADS